MSARQTHCCWPLLVRVAGRCVARRLARRARPRRRPTSPDRGSVRASRSWRACRRDRAIRRRRRLRRQPQLKPQYLKEWQDRCRRFASADAKGQPLANNAIDCLPDGMPGMMTRDVPDGDPAEPRAGHHHRGGLHTGAPHPDGPAAEVARRHRAGILRSFGRATGRATRSSWTRSASRRTCVSRTCRTRKQMRITRAHEAGVADTSCGTRSRSTTR